MSQSNFPGHHEVIVSNIGMWINQTVLKLDIKAHPILLNIELAPIDTQGLANSFGFFGSEVLFACHAPPVSILGMILGLGDEVVKPSCMQLGRLTEAALGKGRNSNPLFCATKRVDLSASLSQRGGGRARVGELRQPRNGFKANMQKGIFHQGSLHCRGQVCAPTQGDADFLGGPAC